MLKISYVEEYLGRRFGLAQVWVFQEHHGAGLEVSVLGAQESPYVDNVVRSTGPKGDQNRVFCRK